MRLVPVVVVVPEATVDALSEWAADDEARSVLTPMRPTMAQSGWTNEMVLGGMALRKAIDRILEGGSLR